MVALFTSFIALCAHYMPLFHVWGSKWLFITGGSIVAPLSGWAARWRGVALMGLWYWVRFGSQATVAFSCATIVQVYHIPTICAAAYLAMIASRASGIAYYVQRLFVIGAMAACMALFWMHPEGVQAWGYALYWVIPMATIWVPRRFSLIHAFGSTFVAHALGSVAWIWSHPAMSAAAWNALIPVVLVERSALACGMWVAMMACAYLAAFVRAKSRQIQVSCSGQME